MSVENDVRRCRIVVRSFDSVDPGSGGHTANRCAHIRPSCASIASDLDVAVIGPCPDHVSRQWRLRDCRDGSVSLGSGVLPGDAAVLDPGFRRVAGRKIRADYSPALAAVARSKEMIYAEEYRGRIVRRHDERCRPVEPEHSGASRLRTKNLRVVDDVRLTRA